MTFYSHKHKLSLFYIVVSTILLICCMQPCVVEACSSRSIPKPRNLSSAPISATPPALTTTAAPPPSTTTTTTTTTSTTTTTPRPNITFPTYKCPGNYDAWYCLNEATCFSVKLGDSVMYNCECANGFMGPRCEYKEIDASFLPKRPRPMLEKASIAGGATCALLLVLFICLTLYLRYDRGGKEEDEDDVCFVAGKTCRYCHKRQCGVVDDDAAGAGAVDSSNVEPPYGALSLRRYFEAFSMSFTIKRTTKL